MSSKYESPELVRIGSVEDVTGGLQDGVGDQMGGGSDVS
jgi:hypothetical protein